MRGLQDRLSSNGSSGTDGDESQKSQRITDPPLSVWGLVNTLGEVWRRARRHVRGHRLPPKAVDGGLVQKDLGVDGARYVIPLCAHHVALQTELSISAYTRFVVADLLQTCEQRPPLFVRTGLGRARLI